MSIFYAIIFYLSSVKDENKITESNSPTSRFTMHWTLFTMHWTLCEIAPKWSVFVVTSIQVCLYLLVTFIEFVFMQKNSKIRTRVFNIITKASRHMCSLYAYITSLQHNKISSFFVMKCNLPTNWIFFAFFGNTEEKCLLSFFSTSIYQQIDV